MDHQDWAGQSKFSGAGTAEVLLHCCTQTSPVLLHTSSFFYTFFGRHQLLAQTITWKDMSYHILGTIVESCAIAFTSNITFGFEVLKLKLIRNLMCLAHQNIETKENV
jgi:hypothetical protein